ncbi:hypothetical protein P153DRAFT_428238 [Dothidotthia symphoricarpi CBS 119687]|uniref:Uncharacterized protein n=1 Tax=Dothidotthia symphoricarpi CBS 119687 TaxID=1392245 RepID=A0A6A6AQH9_9PLEO|nr:uncharacterized protein P153DRAFT_428238 [Dothidotthia symphoricarpi CBS 119687]KAF2133204.1 hypothetical protein P153DRAFT_428238 [Dothidotthia symphoricarpi CBS 119687]
MNSMRTLTLVVVAASAAAEVVNNGGRFGDSVFAPAMAPRDEVCPELPAFCTGPAMLHGEATTLTYLCPEKTKVPSTVHVTITTTTTVTEAGATSSVAPVPTLTALPENTSVAPEPTTTTTIHSTSTQYKTVTVSKIHSTSEASIPTPVPTQDEPVYTIQTSIPSSIPAETSAVQYPTFSLPVANGTTIGVSFSNSICNSSLVAPTPFYPNSTAHGAYGTPTANFVRQLDPAESSTALGTNMAGQTSVSLFTLFLGVVAVALAI